MHKHSRRTCFFLAGLLAALAACGGASPPAKQAHPAEPNPTLEYQEAGDAVLGVRSEIVAAGDLAGNGTLQILAIQGEPIGDSARDDPSQRKERKIWRAALMEKQGGRWQELLRADQHLKNGYGYLGATPPEAVASWMMRWEQGPRGMTFFFTPVTGRGANPQPIPVRWNRAVGRYQAMDATGKMFLSDQAMLSPVKMDLRRRKR